MGMIEEEGDRGNTSPEETSEGGRRVKVITLRIVEMAQRMPMLTKYDDPGPSDSYPLHGGELNFEIEEGEQLVDVSIASPPGAKGVWHMQVPDPDGGGLVNLRTKLVVAQAVMAKEREIVVHETEEQATREAGQALAQGEGQAQGASGEDGAPTEARGSRKDRPGKARKRTG